MAHDLKKKAHAIALILTGESISQVARITGVPKQTVSRWKQIDAQPYFRALHESLYGKLKQNGTKKRKVEQ